jgi:hypothetical protein
MKSPMRNNLLLLAMATIGLAGSAAAQRVHLPESQVRIDMRADFVARTPEVRLGDVADLYTRDLPTIQRLSALSLGRAPSAGTEAVLRRDVIARWVRSRLGIDADRIDWGDVEETHVRTLEQHVSAARIEQAANNALREWLGHRASRYEINTLALPGDVKLPVGEVELKARPLAVNLTPQSRMVVWMDVLVAGRFVRTVPVSFAVAAHRDARVVRGDWVALHVTSGLVQVEQRAQALQDGQLGQVVKVRAANNANPVEARVVAPGRVEVAL